MRSTPVVAAFGDDVGGAEIARQLLAGLVAAHRDDAFGAELLGGQHAAQAHRAVADHGHGLAGADVGRDGAEPPGAEDVGGGQEVRDEIGGRNLGGGDQGAVGQRHPHPLGLGSARGAEDLAIDAGRLVAGLTDLAGVVGSEERPDHELARA